MLFAFSTFVGALLLLAVEPMLGKWVLPLLGGSAATWAACMVCFQGTLLAGYLYADAGAHRLSVRVQTAMHAGLALAGIGLCLVMGVPKTPGMGALGPSLTVPWIFLSQIGLPYFVLSATGPIVQRAASSATGHSPYSLYALSNAGSLIGLFAYPAFIEPHLDLSDQLRAWKVAFAAFTVLLVVLAVDRRDDAAVRTVSDLEVGGPAFGRKVSWLVLGFVPSAVLLAATDHVTVDIAATPILWVVPLSLYLASFVVAFSVSPRFWRRPALLLWFVAALGVGLDGFEQARAPLGRQLGATFAAVFTAALLAHGELARTRPHPRHLTQYYSILATGGVLGGLFVGYFAPFVFTDYYELELGALGTWAILLFAAHRGGRHAFGRVERMGTLLGAGVVIPLLLGSIYARARVETSQGRVVERRRSLLGTLRIVDTKEARILTLGRIQHGLELRDPALRRLPTAYFGPGTALARVLTRRRSGRPSRIGVVGLGVGTIAAYGRPGDLIRFYELDPNVIDVAKKDFTFIADSRARVQIELGDGRLLLGRERDAHFDVLVLDAFSSDAVPVHLLTREAFAIYLRDLAPDGLLLANVSNRYLAVDRVVRGSARALGLACAVLETPSDPERHVSHVEWALVARHPDTIAALGRDAEQALSVGGEVRWTDDRASLWTVLK